MGEERIGVVGAGIVGLAVARRLQQLRPGSAVTVLEKEPAVGCHQTGHNSGVVHAGLYYAPGSLKAELCRRGRDLLREYCMQYSLPFEVCGKVVVARNAAEVPALREVERRARASAVPGLRWLTPEGLREIEPHAVGVAALHSPSTAITDFPAVACALADEIRASGGDVRLGFEVTAIARPGGSVRVSGGGVELAFDRLVVCAGLQADRVARLAGDGPGPAIVPFRGEYYRLVPDRSHLVRSLIYPVPDAAYPFLGVHFTRRVGGGVDVGPNAVLALAREGYRRSDCRVGEMAEILSWPGFRVLARRHWRVGIAEMATSVSKRAFVARASTFLPELTAADLTGAPAGVRAQALDADGSLVDDFRFGGSGPVVTVRNAPSPAATSALAIAEHVADRVLSAGDR